MSLRELTHEKHKEAESHPFVKALFTKQLSVNTYAQFLFNKMIRYSVLEHKAHQLELLHDLSGIERATKMLLDFTTLPNIQYIKHASTLKYIDHINSLTDPTLVLAHIYTLHMGDMYGGQMMKDLVPTPGYMFHFDNRAELIATLRQKLSDDMANEANKAFDFAIQLFDELAHDL